MAGKGEGLVQRAYALIERRGFAIVELADGEGTVKLVTLFSEGSRCDGEIADGGGTVNFDETALLAVC